jgi:hypothetical protein
VLGVRLPLDRAHGREGHVKGYLVFWALALAALLTAFEVGWYLRGRAVRRQLAAMNEQRASAFRLSNQNLHNSIDSAIGWNRCLELLHRPGAQTYVSANSPR